MALVASGKRGRWLVLLRRLILSHQLDHENSVTVGFFIFRKVSMGLILSAEIRG